MYKIDIKYEINDTEWDTLLEKNSASTFFQTAKYLNSENEDRYPIFISIKKDNEIKGQLGITIVKNKTGSTKYLRKISQIGMKFGKRGFWVSGPIIHSENNVERKEILQSILDALEKISKNEKLTIIDGYTSPQDFQIDQGYLKKLKENNFTIQDFVTFAIDLEKNDIDGIWSNFKKNARNDVTKAEREEIKIHEISTRKELEEYKTLVQRWALTKGIDSASTNESMERDWNYIQNSIQKIFYAEQDEKFLAGLRIGCFNSIAYTHQVINSYSSSGNVAGPLLTWNAIKWAKKSNFKFYDCSGGEKRPDDKTKQKKYSEQWDTLFAYKKKWGGDEYPYFHFTKVQNKIKYKIAKISSKPDLVVRNYRKKHFKKGKN